MWVSWSDGGLLHVFSQSKGIQKPKKQIKPIDGTKFLQGRVAPHFGDRPLVVYPTSKFFLKFFIFFVFCLLYVKFCKVVFYCL